MLAHSGDFVGHCRFRRILGLVVALSVVACGGGGGGDNSAAPDTTPPVVSATSPARDATGVALNSSVSATFSEPMMNSTLTTASFTLATTAGGAAVAGTVGVSGNTATFTPSAPLAGSTQYTAIITTAAKDAAGNALAANYSWNFTTVIASSGLEFPSNDQVPDGQTVRFKFTNPHLSGLPIYGPGGNGVTYIFKVLPKQQTGYYTTFFWGNDDGQGTLDTFFWKNGLTSDTYYGAHPYPNSASPDGTTHSWEISVDGGDVLNGAVDYGRWHTQALRVWRDASGNKHHEFYWDLPLTDLGHVVTYVAPTTYGEMNPPEPALTFGDAPWQPGKELCSCVLRGIQIYSSLLSPTDIQQEIASPLSTAAGSASIWYLNLNPTPSDILDKSGRGHNPDWVGNLRPNLWNE